MPNHHNHQIGGRKFLNNEPLGNAILGLVTRENCSKRTILDSFDQDWIMTIYCLFRSILYLHTKFVVVKRITWSILCQIKNCYGHFVQLSKWSIFTKGIRNWGHFGHIISVAQK